LNAYGAAPPPAPPAGLLVPNAVGGQAQPVIASDAGDGAALAAPDALDSKVETGTGSNYARIYVTDSTSGAIAYTSRLGAVPSSASPAEPSVLTNPGSLGYNAPEAATLTTNSAVGSKRDDKLFDGQDGIYNYTTGVHFTRAEKDLGVRATGEIIIAAGVKKEGDNSAVVVKNLDLSATGDIRLWAGGKVKQFASGNSENYYHGTRKTTVVGHNESTVYGDAISKTYSNIDTGAAGHRTTITEANQTSETKGDSVTTTFGNVQNRTFGS
jgi:hypothetical protein